MPRFPHLRRLRAPALVLALLVVAAAGCSGLAGSPTGDAAPDPTPAPDAAVDARTMELSVAEVTAMADGEPASVRAVVWGNNDGYWLCEALEPSGPPSCAGQRLAVTDAGALVSQLQVPLAVDGDVAWLAEPAVLWGYRRSADRFEPNPAASGSDTTELSEGY